MHGTVAAGQEHALGRHSRSRLCTGQAQYLKPGMLQIRYLHALPILAKCTTGIQQMDTRLFSVQPN